MAAYLGGNGGGEMLPRRLTQLFSDNKKSYEALVQARQAGPELSPLHLKLRIQKDRLIAWGIQWSDRSTAAKAGDIDDSLDRAGISDLVASIMCSIRDLLDEAESLQPQRHHQPPFDYDMSRKLGKRVALAATAAAAADSTAPAGEWTPENLKRLEEILKDLTTSIDTLCDLSRPRVESVAHQDPEAKSMQQQQQQQRSPDAYKAPVEAASRPRSSVAAAAAATIRPLSMDARARNDSPARRSDLTDMTYIDPSLLRSQSAIARAISAPPSYESIAAGSENRVLAYFSLSSPSRAAAAAAASAASSSSANHFSPSVDGTVDPASETPVLLDYRQSADRGSTVSRPNSARFEELLMALLQLSSWRGGNRYTGILKLTGWTNDAPRARCAYVYEIPRTEEEVSRPALELQPRSLLAFLQNGGDTDSSNIPSLDNRYRLALNIATSLMHLHGMNVTHRNVNSNNVLFFVDKESKSLHDKVWKAPLLRKPYLTGFHQMNAGSSSDREREAPAYSGIYYHPGLSGAPASSYDFVHDYYGLGLLLLEIGLWMPVGKFFKAKYTLGDFKARIQDIYMKKLAAKCGESYMEASLYCMTAAEKNPSLPRNGGGNGNDANVVGDFQVNVVRALERCCMIEGRVRKDETIENFAEDQAAQPAEARPESDVITPPSSEISQQAMANVSLSQSISQAPAAASDDATERALEATKKIRVWSHELPDLYSKYWSSTMFPKLERILRKALSRWESYTIDLFMAGEDADTARPTVYMECSSTSKVRKILRHLNKDLRLFEISVVSGQIVRSKAAKKKKTSTATAAKSTLVPTSAAGGARQLPMEHAGEDLNPHYQAKPACGASIGAYLDGSHLPPVTFGGAILVDGEPFGMSVHHMLEDDEAMQLALDEPVDLRRSMAAPRLPPMKAPHDTMVSLQAQFTGLYPFEVSEPAEGEDAASTDYAYSDYSSGTALSSGGGGGDGHGSPRLSHPHSRLPPEALYPFEISEDDDDDDDEGARFSFGGQDDDDDLDDEFWLDPNFDAASVASDDDDLDCDMGDTDGIRPGAGQALIVTQPALDDVSEGFFPSPEDATFEHLTSHSLGYIHASSGLRRSRTAGSVIHEIDWALIKINASRLLPTTQLNNPLAAARGAGAGPLSSLLPPPPHPSPAAIFSSEALASRSVHTHGRSSGLFARGTVLPTMRLVRMPGRISPSHSWQVRGSFGAGGDSGAWVFDDATGAVCGHVLAYSERSAVAYIAPMDIMLNDMERVLGGRVSLPGQDEGRTILRETPLPTFPSHHPAAAGSGHGVGKQNSVRTGRGPALPEKSRTTTKAAGGAKDGRVRMEGNLMGMGAGVYGVSARC